VDAFLNTSKVSAALPAPPAESVISKLSDEEIEQCLKEISTMDLAKSFKGMSSRSQKRIFNTLPKRGAAFLREALEQMDEVAPEEIAEAQEKIEAVLKDLSVRRPPEGLAN
jgi:flagellar motor switch protein FliG